MELDIFFGGLELVLDEQGIVVEATMVEPVSRVMIVWNELDAPLLLQVEIDKGVILLARFHINIIICSNMEVFVGSFDRQRGKISFSACFPEVILWPHGVGVETNIHIDRA